MKKNILLITGILFFTTLHAQDVIAFKNGTQLNGKVIEVGISEIKYKKSDSANARIYIISKKDVIDINYKDGSKDIFNPVKTQSIETPRKKDTVHIVPFIRIGICVGNQIEAVTSIDNISNGGYDYDEEGNKAAGHGLYPMGDFGITLNQRIKLDMEVDYQTGNYYDYYGVSYSPPYNINNNNASETINNEAIFLIPNVFITANQHLFTPYARPGIMFTIINHYNETYESSSLQNGAIITSKSYPICTGILLDGGCEVRLSTHFFIFGELYLKAIISGGNEYGEPASSDGISAGIKVVL